MKPLNLVVFTPLNKASSLARAFRLVASEAMQLMGIPYNINVVHVPDDGSEIPHAIAVIDGRVEIAIEQPEDVEAAVELLIRTALEVQTSSNTAPLAQAAEEPLSVLA